MSESKGGNRWKEVEGRQRVNREREREQTDNRKGAQTKSSRVFFRGAGGI